MGSSDVGTEGIELDRDISDEELDALINSNDADALEALMQGKTPAIANQPDKPAEEVKKDEPTDDKSETGEEIAASGETEESEEIEGRPPIQSKDGKRFMPYKALEVQRDRAKNAEAEARELRTQLEELQGKSTKVSDFLKAKGIDPNEIDAAQVDSLTDEELTQLDAIDPLVGKAVRLLSQRAPQIENTTQQSQAEDPNAIVESDPHLSQWAKSDPDRWAHAVAIDNQLATNPKFKNASFKERFAEVVKQVRSDFGDDAEADQNKKTDKEIDKRNEREMADKKVAEAAAAAIPRSLSNIGNAPSAEKSLVEQLAEMSPEEIHARWHTFTPAQQDEILAAVT